MAYIINYLSIKNLQSGGSWCEQCGTGVGEDLNALGNSEEYEGGGSYSGGEGNGCVNSCCDAAVTVTVGDRSIQDGGMFSGVSDGFERLQQHSEIEIHNIVLSKMEIYKSIIT